MFNIDDEKLRAFCAPVANIDYLIGVNISKTCLCSEDYLDLRLLYAINEERISKGQQSFMAKRVDISDKVYAFLTPEGVDYAKKNYFSFASGWHTSVETKMISIEDMRSSEYALLLQKLQDLNSEDAILKDCDETLQQEKKQHFRLYNHMKARLTGDASSQVLNSQDNLITRSNHKSFDDKSNHYGLN